MEPLTFEQQIAALGELVADWAIQKSAQVKGPYTSGDFVAWQLAQIFTPAGWNFLRLEGPELVTLSDQSAYVRFVGRLEVTFANGQVARQDDIGIWPLKATRGTDLAGTAAERYETVEKAARTDALKNAARNLGLCFAPLTDLHLQEHVRREAHARSPQGRATAQKTPQQLVDESYDGPPSSTNNKPLQAFAATIIKTMAAHYPDQAAVVQGLKDTGHWPFKASQASKARRALETQAERQALAAGIADASPVPAILARVQGYVAENNGKWENQPSEEEQRRTIYKKLARDLGLDDAARHRLQLAVFGKESLTDFSFAEAAATLRWMSDQHFTDEVLAVLTEEETP